MSRFWALVWAAIAVTGIVCVSVMAFEPGDLDGDGIVDNVDLAILGQAWGSYCGAPNYNANADLNSDCVVNLVDLAILGKFWGTCEDCCCEVEEGCENTSGMENTACIYGQWLCRHTPLPENGIDEDYYKQLGIEIGLSFVKEASCVACGPLCLLLGAAGGLPGLICAAACVLWCAMP